MAPTWSECWWLYTTSVMGFFVTLPIARKMLLPRVGGASTGITPSSVTTNMLW